MLGRGCSRTRVLKLIIFQYICLYTFTFTPLGVIMPRRKGTNSYIYIYIYRYPCTQSCVCRNADVSRIKHRTVASLIIIIRLHIHKKPLSGDYSRKGPRPPPPPSGINNSSPCLPFSGPSILFNGPLFVSPHSCLLVVPLFCLAVPFFFSGPLICLAVPFLFVWPRAFGVC